MLWLYRVHILSGPYCFVTFSWLPYHIDLDRPTKHPRLPLQWKYHSNFHVFLYDIYAKYWSHKKRKFPDGWVWNMTAIYKYRVLSSGFYSRQEKNTAEYISYMRNIWLKLELHIRHVKLNCCFNLNSRQLCLHHQNKFVTELCHVHSSIRQL